MAEGKGEREDVAILLGKGLQPPMRRTTSMMVFSATNFAAASAAADWREGIRRSEQNRAATFEMPPRIVQRRSFNDFRTLETTAQFLMACGRCNRRLGPGSDTFIYHLECREHKMSQDKNINKRLTPKKTDASSSTKASETPGSGEMAIAA
ncbi:FCS-Like Zinc finger 7-like isoform X2 [Musa acuminata AAA Group]|uniref:FCS-Like Zinc finger 7-like isoform X2 n=1 Tax=Musa acuminata AAA Group TaxID=214697 RepID=UPI0031D4A4A2